MYCISITASCLMTWWPHGSLSLTQSGAKMHMRGGGTFLRRAKDLPIPPPPLPVPPSLGLLACVYCSIWPVEPAPHQASGEKELSCEKPTSNHQPPICDLVHAAVVRCAIGCSQLVPCSFTALVLLATGTCDDIKSLLTDPPPPPFLSPPLPPCRPASPLLLTCSLTTASSSSSSFSFPHSQQIWMRG